MSCAHGGQVLVEGVPLLWKDRERFRGAVHWFPNDASDADALKHRELWCERSKTAIDTMMGTFNVPWFLVVNAGKAAIRELADGWTIVTKDHSLSAQWEHTVLVTQGGFEVLTTSAGAPPAPDLPNPD